MAKKHIPKIKQEKEEKNRSRKKRTFYNRLAMGIFVAGLLVMIVYSIKSIKKIDLTQPGKHPFKGNPSSKVIVSEFSDFQCPACRAAEPSLKQLMTDYPDKIKLVFYNYPLTANHPWAMLAAEAASCADLQGKFWPYHDLLYDRQDAWVKDSAPDKIFKGYAVELGLETGQFNNCLDQKKTKGTIEEDQSLGDALVVNSTPTLYVNQTKVEGIRLPEIKHAVETELALHP